MSGAQSNTVSKGQLIKWAVTTVIAAGILAIPTNETYSYEVKMFLFVTALGILLVAFELIDLMAVSMMFPIGYLVSVFGVDANDAVSSYWRLYDC